MTVLEIIKLARRISSTCDSKEFELIAVPGRKAFLSIEVHNKAGFLSFNIIRDDDNVFMSFKVDLNASDEMIVDIIDSATKTYSSYIDLSA